MTDSQRLLAEYRQHGSDAAFRKLAARFVDMVHSTALRLVGGDTHRAEDVTQTVFVDLARQARTLPAEVRLGGWLHRHTCFVAANTLRGERRRQARERQAVEMNALQNHSEADFSQVAPLLDEAINELGEADRTAILLRFFEQQDFHAVGQALGSNEDAARMRVTRALEKLEEFLKRRGVTTSAASLGVVLTANAVQAAPVGLAVTISTAAALAGATIATTATATATKAIAMTTLQKTIVGAVLAAAVGTGIYEARQASSLRTQVQSLQQQQSPLVEQVQQLTKDRDNATRQLATMRDDNERLGRNTAELLKMRAEVSSRLRSSSAQPDPTISEKAAVPNQPTPPAHPQTGRTPEVWSYPQSLQKLAFQNYARVTNALANAKSDVDRYLVLSEAAKLAFSFGNTEDARNYAIEVLALDKRFLTEPWRGGDAVFFGNLVLGRIALLEGRTEEATQYLLESGNTVGSPVLGSFGPNMTLATDLLQVGERDTVLKYFNLCRKFWGTSGDDKLSKWAQDVESGRMPDFGGNLYY